MTGKMNTTTVITCHPAQDPMPDIMRLYPDHQLYNLYPWNPDMASFLKAKALLWAKQRCTRDYVLVIHFADNLSVPMMSLITGVIDQGFSRPVVFVVQSTHRLPYSLLRKSNVIHSLREPSFAPGWTALSPLKEEHMRWESVLNG